MTRGGRAGVGSATWWGLALILALTAAARLLAIDAPLERDEGEYAYAGQLLLQGVPPYAAAYNMKFPGTYGAYAAILAVFGSSIRGIHAGLMVGPDRRGPITGATGPAWGAKASGSPPRHRC